MNGRQEAVFLVDVDNTLLDNDGVTGDIMAFLTDAIGVAGQRLYLEIFEGLRTELGYADYLGALQRYRIAQPTDVHLLELSSYLVNYPFAERLYPGALEAIQKLRELAPVVILSDGDVVFQPLKVERSGISAAVDGNVLIYIHKEKMLDDVERRYPAGHYVMFDDKLRILSDMHEAWGSKLTTVFLRQGHYANDPGITARYRTADLSVDSMTAAASLGPAAFGLARR
jgi:FMN phosphatase YigB (HAD superfamily)